MAKKLKKRYRRILRNQLFLRRLCNPVFLVVYAYAWYITVQICKYGEAQKNIPRLTVCLIFFGIYLLAYIIGYARFLSGGKKDRNNEVVFEVIEIVKVEENVAILCSENKSFSFDFDEIKKAVRTRNWIYLYLKNNRFVVIGTKNMSEYDVEFFKLKISQINPLKKINLRLVVCVLLIAITIMGGRTSYQSALHFNGKLAWFINDLKDKRTVRLLQNNIYENGIDGIMKAVGSKVDLPAKLTVAEPFDLIFTADGKIIEFETMLYGYDENENYVNSYLLSYDAKHSAKIEINLNGGKSDLQYDAQKDFQPLIDAMQVIPLKDKMSTMKNSNSEKFGILYSGKKNGEYSFDSITYLGTDGAEITPSTSQKKAVGDYVVSLYYPLSTGNVIPIARYIYIPTS